MHMKRLTAPKTWNIKRKEGKFIIRPLPSGHPASHSMPLVVMIRDVIHMVSDSREAKKIITGGHVTVDGVARTSPKFSVGLMDVIEVQKSGKTLRISLDDKGRLAPVEIPASEKARKICRIKVKKHVRGGDIHFGLHDGRSILSKGRKDNGYRTGDSVLIQLPDQKLLKHFPMEKDMSVVITSGKHAGELGLIKELKAGGNVVIKADDGDVFETLSRYVLILGKNKPEIKVR